MNYNYRWNEWSKGEYNNKWNIWYRAVDDKDVFTKLKIIQKSLEEMQNTLVQLKELLVKLENTLGEEE